MNGKNAIWYAQGIDNSGLEKGKREAKAIWQQMANDATDAGVHAEKIWKKAGAAIGVVIGAATLKEFIGNMVKIRGEFQQLEIAFTTMLKSGEKSKKLMSDLTQFAAETPFGLQSAASGAKQLLAYGSTAETVIDELRMLGDVAAGTGQTINDLVYLYGTLRTQGRAYMMDIRQFAGRGIPIYDELAKVLNTTKDNVNDFVTAGRVGFKEVEQAFKNMTSEGGLYGGLMEKQSESVLGRIEQLRDAIDMMFNEIGESNEGIVYSAISGAASLVENYEKVGKILVGLITTYGVYKAALIAVNAIERQRILFNKLVQEQMIIESALRKGATADMIREAATTKALAIAKQGLVNNLKTLAKSLAPNPYALAAAAVAALAYGTYKLATYQTDAEKAQKKFNDAVRESNRAIESEKHQIDAMFARLKSAKKGTEEYTAARKAIIGQYGGYLKQLGNEKTALNDIAAAYTLITEEAKKAARARAMESFTSEASSTLAEKEVDIKDEIKKLLDKKYKGQKGEDGISLAETYYWKIVPVIEGEEKITPEIEEILKDFNVDVAPKFIDNVQTQAAYVKNVMQDQLDAAAKARAIYGKTMDEARLKFGESPNKDKHDKAIFDVTKASLQQLEAELPKAQEALKELRSAEAPDPAAIRAQEQLIENIKAQTLAREAELRVIREVEEQIKSLQEEQKNYGKDDAEYKALEFRIKTLRAKLPKAEKAEESAADKTRKQAEAITDQQEKVKQLMDKQALDRKRTEEDLENQESQTRINAMQAGFDKEQAQRELNNKLEIQSLERQRDDYIRTVIEAERQLFDERQELEQRRNKKHVKAVFDPSSISVDSSRFDQIITETEVRQTQETLEDILKEFRTFEQKKFDLAKEYDDKIAQMKSGNTDGIYDAQIEEAKRQRDLAVLEMQASQSNFYEVLFGNLEEYSITAIKKAVADAKALIDAYKNKAKQEGRALSPDETKAITKLQQGLTDAEKSTKTRLPDGLKKTARELDGIVGSVSQFDEGLGAALDTVSKIVGGVGDISGGIGGFSDTLKNIKDQKGEEGFAGFSVGDIAGFASGFAGAASSVISGLTSIIGLFGGGKDHMAEFRREASLLNDELARTKLNAKIENNGKGTIFGEDTWRAAIDNIDNLREALEEYNKALDDIAGRRRRGGFFGAAMDKLGIKNDFDSIEESIASMQIKIRHSTWFRDAKYQSLKDAVPELFNKDGSVDMDALNAFIGSDTFKKLSQENQGYLQNMADDWEVYQNAVEAVKDYFSDIFGDLGNEMSDALVDSFKNGTDAAEAFGDSVSGMLENLTKQMAFSVAFGDALEQAQNEVDALIDKKSKGLLTEDEFLNAIMKTTDKLVDSVTAGQDVFNSVLERAKEYAASLGHDILGSDEERSASAKGIAQASQDTVDELNGRFTAVQGHTYEINENIKASVPVWHGMNNSISEIHKDIQSWSADTLRYLAGIHDNTDHLQYMRDDLRVMRSDISEIRDRGLKVQ